MVRVRDRIDRMPLQLAPQAGTGIVDGRRVIRFRAQLGYGRTFRPTARVWSVLQDGVEAPVAVQVPDRRLCGPWTLCVDAVEGAAAYVVAMEAHEGERTWSARQRYETSQLVEGRFGHGIVGDGRLRFSADWDRVSALDGPAPE